MKQQSGISEVKRTWDTLTCAFHAFSFCSHSWLRCFHGQNLLNAHLKVTLSVQDLFYGNLLYLLWTPFFWCCLSARSFLRELYSVQFHISKSSMGWKIRKRVSESVSGMPSQNSCVQQCARARLSVLKQLRRENFIPHNCLEPGVFKWLQIYYLLPLDVTTTLGSQLFWFFLRNIGNICLSIREMEGLLWKKPVFCSYNHSEGD